MACFDDLITSSPEVRHPGPGSCGKAWPPQSSPHSPQAGDARAGREQ